MSWRSPNYVHGGMLRIPTLIGRNTLEDAAEHHPWNFTHSLTGRRATPLRQSTPRLHSARSPAVHGRSPVENGLFCGGSHPVKFAVLRIAETGCVHEPSHKLRSSSHGPLLLSVRI